MDRRISPGSESFSPWIEIISQFSPWIEIKFKIDFDDEMKNEKIHIISRSEMKNEGFAEK